MARYNTNLASEFHVLSSLYRLGVDANLTLGNKKSVDIVVINEKGYLITIDVKGIAKKYDWPADNIKAPKHGAHFIALVSYEDKFTNPEFTPNVWIIPYEKLKKYTKQYKTRKNVSRSKIVNNAKEYLNAWDLITKKN
jgi:transposase-like protein